MSLIRDDGPAFPTSSRNMFLEGGLTMRDYCAAHASEDDIERFKFLGHSEEYVIDHGNGNKSIGHRAAAVSRERARYRFADAMMEARKC